MFEVILCAEPTIKNTEEINLDANLEKNLSILDKFTLKGNDALKNWKKIEQIIKR